MVTTPEPLDAASMCSCGHSASDHEFVLLNPDGPMEGPVLCPQCRCFATWSANSRASTPAERAATRARVLAQLAEMAVDLRAGLDHCSSEPPV
jgi:hypothetical protein